MLGNADEIAENRRSATVLVTPAAPLTTHHEQRRLGGMADSHRIPVPVRHPRANNWKGGRSVASNGYVLIRVGKEHHLADVRGYAYEHRLVAEQKLGRRLMKGEIPHHINGVKTDNRPENIEVVESQFAHRVRHRTKPSGLQMPHETNQLVACECGCGEMFAKFDGGGRPRRFMSGHNRPAAPTETAILEKLATGSKHRGELGQNTKAIASALSKLKSRGVVRQLGKGRWERVVCPA